MSFLDTYANELAALDAGKLLRTRRVVDAAKGSRLRVGGRDMLAFCGNDYLGLSQHPALIEASLRGAQRYGVGATASPLVCGHSASHEALEQEIANFLDLPRALYFYAGFATNVGIVPALVGRGDAVFCDALNHACLIDGARLSRAEIKVYPHSDLAALEKLLGESTAQRKLIATDAVFSMDGDVGPLRELLSLAERHDALLLIDDAHGFGVLGPDGRGTAAHFNLRSPNLLVMGTMSKAAGGAGGFVAGHETMIEWLMQRTRSYIFATAAPAMVTESLRASLKLIETEDWRRERLRSHTARLRSAIALPAGADVDALPRLLPSPTAIQPLIVGENGAALDLMAHLWREGLWVPAIRPPTVPPGTARLRISLSAAHSDADIDQLITALRVVNR
ncbi:8-amino-7-oxononanoate synthase [Piscinibacter terrae]|uniref:8-amino-7-oxononanoate synthase n=1 Tax=Piscinibacter terrae TaxID=2496871 RepID=A0A3N7IYU1_9BURK|nr:8-amino-7-oxononanoate synthase [Albitalea terrae]RQP23902.1 8-amino-7-oxononanoate synthase [Albitalea terrae]